MKTRGPAESVKAGPSGSEGTGVGQGFPALTGTERVGVDWEASQLQASVRPCGAWRNRRFGWGVPFSRLRRSVFQACPPSLVTVVCLKLALVRPVGEE